MAGLIALNMPQGITRLISANLGTEKLQRQLTEPNLDEVDDPLVVEFLRAALISDLKLPASGNTLSSALERLKPSPYLTEAMIWKIFDLRWLDRISERQFEKLAPKLADSIAFLKGGTAEDRGNEKRRQLVQIRKREIVLRLKSESEQD